MFKFYILIVIGSTLKYCLLSYNLQIYSFFSYNLPIPYIYNVCLLYDLNRFIFFLYQSVATQHQSCISLRILTNIVVGKKPTAMFSNKFLIMKSYVRFMAFRS